VSTVRLSREVAEASGLGDALPRAQSGFTLIEMIIVVGIAATILAVSVPAFRSFRQSSDLHNAAGAIVEQLMIARQKAIATGTQQQMRFIKGFGGTSDYHIWNNNVASPSWTLPPNINYYWGSGTTNSYRMTSDGRCLDSGLLILETSRGIRDTISIRTSGLVFAY